MWNYFIIVLVIISLIVISKPLFRSCSELYYLLKSWNKKKLDAQLYSELKKINKHEAVSSSIYLSKEQIEDKLSHVIQLCERFEICFYLIIMEINHFSTLIEKMSNNEKEKFFKIARRRIVRTLREIDIVEQLNENSFMIVLPMKYNISNAGHIVHRLQNSILSPFLIDKKVITVAANMGLAIYPDDGVSSNELWESVNDATEIAKEIGENKYYFHKQSFTSLQNHESMLSIFLQKVNVSDLLKIRTNIYTNLYTKKIEYIYLVPSVEHETLGFVELDKYPHAVLASGKGVEIFENLIIHAIRQIPVWKNEYTTIKAVIVPITMKQIFDSEILDKIIQLLHQNKIYAEELIFDILVADFSHNSNDLDKLIKLLDENNLKASFTIFLFSQLPGLNVSKLPIRILKIDWQVVHDLQDNDANISIIKMIAEIAKNSNITMIADKVSSDREKSMLKNIDCRIIYEDSINVLLNESSAILYKKKMKSNESFKI